MENVINEFRGKYFFLSNFFEIPIMYNGYEFGSSEAAFQAAKCPYRMQEFISLTPSEAKRHGRQVYLREDWELLKDDIMYDVVLKKFTQHPDLGAKLLETGNAELQEGNTWNDCYWGICNGNGKNMLGKILMRVREELKNKNFEK